MITSFNYRPVLIDTPNYQQNIHGFLALGLCSMMAAGPQLDSVSPNKECDSDDVDFPLVIKLFTADSCSHFYFRYFILLHATN